MLMTEHGYDAKVLAGGQSLIPVMNFRLAQPAVLVDLNRIEELAVLNPPDRPNGEALKLGCMVRQSTLEQSEVIRRHVPVVSETMPHIAHSQIRNRGTIGGSLAHADPAAELPLLMVLLEADFHIRREGDSRSVNAEQFYIDLFTTDLAPEEILTAISVPQQPDSRGYAFIELARRHGDYAMAGAAAIIDLDDDGLCQQARLIFLNAGPVPMLAKEAITLLIGEKPVPELIEEVVQQAAKNEIEPHGDIHASTEYKRHLATVLGRRALQIASGRASTSVN